MRSRKWLLDLAAGLLLLLLPLVLFWPVVVGGRTLIPADNLYQFEPYRSLALQQGVTLPPHNELLSDLVLENLVWKKFILQSLDAGELPLWNPYLFAGVPFLAAGQHSALYPPSLLFYVLPLERAYGAFTVLQLWLAGAFMYLFARVLRLARPGALIAGMVYQLSAVMIVSVVFSMIIAAFAWLPLLLAIVELMIRRQELKGAGPFVPIVYVAAGAVALGMLVLAGHPEILVYTLLVTAFYGLARLAALAWTLRGQGLSARTYWRPVLRLAAWLVVMGVLGIGLGAVQLVPLVELVRTSFRQGSVTYGDVIGWAYPKRQILTFLLPNFFGNPAHHGYWDLLARQWVAVDRIFWGVKNYVEAGSYAGILPLLLALVAVLGLRRSPQRRTIAILGLLALVSLLFAFGTPLYALLYYGLPGFKQLHSPFRWVWPYTFSVAVLTGIGVDHLASWARESSSRSRIVAWIAWAAAGGGALLLAVVAVVCAAPGRFVPLAERVLAGSEQARQAFSGGAMFLSYEWRNLLTFALALAAGGLVLLLSRRPIFLSLPGRPRLGRVPLWQPLAVLVVAADLLAFGAGLNPAADPADLAAVPPAIQFLKERAADAEPWRLTTYQVPDGTKTLNANIPWLHGLQDVRGYDSIIPRQYADTVSVIEPQGELLYNRIAPIYGVEHLSSPLLDLLNVRYVVTEGAIPNLDYQLVYSSEVRIYENTDVLPRAFALPRGEAVTVGDVAPRLRTLDPRERVLLDAEMVPPDDTRLASPGDWPLQPARVVLYTANTVFVDVTMPGPGWLVLADSYFSGWKAYRSTPTAEMPTAGTEPEDENEIGIARADGNFRAVWLEAGSYRVRFRYTPLSLKLGLYVSFMGGVLLLLLILYWAWGRFYRESAGDGAVKRVAKNSLLPMGLQLLNKVIDFVFAMLMFRILAPQMAGRYYFAVLFIGYFDILTRFGLGTLLTRDVAKDRSLASPYLSTINGLRAGLWLASLPVMAVVIAVYLRFGGLTADVVAAIALFALSLVLGNLADGFSSVFNAYEKMEYPAAISTVTAITRVSLGVLVLLAGWGFVGVAGVSLAANAVSATILGWLMLRHCLRPRFEWRPGLARQMMSTSFPLMINSLLSTMFFRVDTLLLKPLKGDAVTGTYNAAYAYLNALGIIPAYFTMAIFPLMSRFAAQGRDSLMRAYVLSLRLLLMAALPITACVPFIARELILLLGGAEYLPDGAIALQILIGFLPLSFVNGVTQYVLIAIDQQRFLTRAFLIGATFNIIANLIAIPLFSFRGAAVVTIVSELVLLLPFYYGVRKHLGPLPWASLLWQPLLAAAAMAGVMGLLRGLSWLVLVPIGIVVYVVVLALSGAFRQPDMDVLRALIPARKQWKPRPAER